MIDPHIFAFPLSLIQAVALIICVYLLKGTSVAKWLDGRKLTTLLIGIVAVLIGIEGTWSAELHHTWLFVILNLLILLALGFTVMADWKKRSVCGLLSHAGLLLVLLGGLFGSADSSSALLRVYKDTPEHMAFDAKGNIVPLPFSVELKDFSIEVYDDAVSPKQFTSVLLVDGKEMKTSVNHPCSYHGYHFYQSGYDMENGQYSVLSIVRDPWMFLLAIGALLLSAGAVWSLRKAWNNWKVLVLVAVLAVVFTLISVARINFATLMPALRSLWFIPHLIIYMLAYAILALSMITGIVSLFSGKIPPALSRKFLSTSSSLLLLGMICGAVWAQQAWGTYWAWDAKENWAAVTWLLTLGATHAPVERRKLVLALIVLAFIAMNVTWYGVNYLPSASLSLHTYN